MNPSLGPIPLSYAVVPRSEVEIALDMASPRSATSPALDNPHPSDHGAATADAFAAVPKHNSLTEIWAGFTAVGFFGGAWTGLKIGFQECPKSVGVSCLVGTTVLGATIGGFGGAGVGAVAAAGTYVVQKSGDALANFLYPPPAHTPVVSSAREAGSPKQQLP